MTSTPSEPRLYDVWLMWVEFAEHVNDGLEATLDIPPYRRSV